MMEAVRNAQSDREAAKQVEALERFLTVDGERMRCEYAGRGDALLLLHGLVGSARNWQRNLAAFARHSSVFALDLLNMGGSDRVQGLDASLEATADRVAAAMDALGLDCADLAAHSHGGAVAMMVAARHPTRVRRLILFAPANPFCLLGEGLLRFYQSRLGIWFARLIPSLPLAWKAIALGRMYGDPARVPPDALAGYVDGLHVPGTIDHVLQIVAHWSADMEALRLHLSHKLQTPTLLIWGDRDRAVSPGSALKLQQSFEKVELLLLPGVGHIAFEEDPNTVNEAVAQWLQGSVQELPASLVPVCTREEKRRDVPEQESALMLAS